MRFKNGLFLKICSFTEQGMEKPNAEPWNSLVNYNNKMLQ